MSTLAEAIRKTTRTEPQPIGFSPITPKVKTTLLLVALLPEGAEAPSGVDIVLTQGAPALSPAATQNGSNGKQGRPLHGALLPAGTATVPAGLDFVVFDGDDAPAALLLEEKAGLVMQAPNDLSDSLLQSMQWLPLDALLVRFAGGKLTVRRQLELQRLSGFSRKPLLLVVTDQPPAGELEALREAGVIGIVVDLASADGAARLTALRTAIDGLRPRPKRDRSENPVVSVTPALLPVEQEHDHDDDDEDDE